MAEILNGKKVVFESEAAKAVFLGETGKVDFIKLTINPKSKIEKHSLNTVVNFFVLEGKGILRTKEHNFELKSGDLISLSPNQEREWENPKDKNLEILVIKEKV